MGRFTGSLVIVKLRAFGNSNLFVFPFGIELAGILRVTADLPLGSCDPSEIVISSEIAIS